MHQPNLFCEGRSHVHDQQRTRPTLEIVFEPRKRIQINCSLGLTCLSIYGLRTTNCDLRVHLVTEERAKLYRKADISSAITDAPLFTHFDEERTRQSKPHSRMPPKFNLGQKGSIIITSNHH